MHKKQRVLVRLQISIPRIPRLTCHSLDPQVPTDLRIQNALNLFGNQFKPELGGFDADIYIYMSMCSMLSKDEKFSSVIMIMAVIF